MSTVTETAEAEDAAGLRAEGDWKAGVVAGIVGAVAMAALVLVMNPQTLTVAIPSLYGLAPPESAAAGLVVHVSHGAVLGVAFAALVEAVGSESSTRTVSLGFAWGVAAWVVLAVLLMPLWLSAVGSPADPPFPNVALPSLLWHVVYGVVLGRVYDVLEGEL
jgi:uncharacterized membrane protein YagU involved in acid resistance